jgi:hypothetical protein
VGPDDVALFRLQSPLVYNPWIGPIALPTENSISSGAVTLAGKNCNKKNSRDIKKTGFQFSNKIDLVLIQKIIIPII